MAKDACIRKYSRRYRPYNRRKPYRRVTSAARRSYLGRDRIAPVQRNVYGFADNLVVKLCYSDVINLTSTLSSIAKYAFRMNSCFDPDFTGTGHQPTYYDIYTQIYQKYHVLGAKLWVEFTLQPNAIATAQPSGPVIVGLINDDDGTPASGLTTLMESSKSISRFLGNALGGPDIIRMGITYVPLRDTGLPDSDDTVGAGTGANPSLSYFGSLFATEQGLASPTSVMCKIRLEQTVRFHEIRDLVGS